MNPGGEFKLQLMQRAYCYLRLSGLTEAAALEGMGASLDALISSSQGTEAVWARIETFSASHTNVLVPSAPPLLRGHMVYPP